MGQYNMGYCMVVKLNKFGEGVTGTWWELSHTIREHTGV